MGERDFLSNATSQTPNQSKRPHLKPEEGKPLLQELLFPLQWESWSLGPLPWEKQLLGGITVPGATQE